VKERDNGIKVLEATDRGSTAVSGTFRLVLNKLGFFCCNVTSCSIGEVLLLDVKTEVEKIGLTAKFSATSRCPVPNTDELMTLHHLCFAGSTKKFSLSMEKSVLFCDLRSQRRSGCRGLSLANCKRFAKL
jgi:hypothetical protein